MTTSQDRLELARDMKLGEAKLGYITATYETAGATRITINVEGIEFRQRWPARRGKRRPAVGDQVNAVLVCRDCASSYVSFVFTTKEAT